MAAEAEAKWVGKTKVEIDGVKPDQIWSLIADFGNLHKYSPSFESCSLVDGTVVEIGAVRRCTSKVIPQADGGAAGIAYIKEKLVELDPTRRVLSYQVLENNIGLPVEGYVGTAKVVDSGAGGCAIEWSFVSDPIEGWKSEDMCSLLESTVKSIAERMEAAVKSATA